MEGRLKKNWKSLVLIFSAFFLPFVSSASVSSTSWSSVTQGGSAYEWNPTSVTNSNIACLLYGGYSSMLTNTFQGLTVPTQSTIVGIEVRFTRCGFYASPSDANVLIRVSGTNSPQNKAGAVGYANSGGTSCTPSLDGASYGGPTDLWGFAAGVITPANVGGLNVYYQCVYGLPAFGGMNIGGITVTVYYQPWTTTALQTTMQTTALQTTALRTTSVTTQQQTTALQTTALQTTQQQTTVLRTTSVTTQQQTTALRTTSVTTQQQTTALRTTSVTTALQSTGLGTTGEQTTLDTTGEQTTDSVTTVNVSPIVIVKKKNSHTASIIGGVVGALLGCCLLLIILLLVFYRRKEKKKKQDEQIPLEELSTTYSPVGGPDGKHYDSLHGLMVNGVPQISDEEVEASSIAWEIDEKELEIGAELGRGSFGVVYKGNWRKQPVAVKKMLESEFSQEQRTSFRKEAAVMMKLKPHANVVKLLGVCTRDSLCIVTEFLANGSLEKYLQKNRVDDATAISMARQIAAGMLHLHAEGVIHRDLAARNILLGGDNSVRVSDFGFARSIKSGEKEGQTRNMAGPLKWMSVEALQKQVYSTKSDVWSFGITVIEILTSQPPYPEENAVNVAIMVVSQGLRPKLPEDRPKPLLKLLKRCWATKAEDRPEFTEIYDALYRM